MTDRRSLVALLALNLAIVAIVQPRGDFPLNDDWAYAHSVQWLLTEGRVRLSHWIAMNLLPQTLAGGLVTALFGFSFETLRHLTQAVALATSLAAYGWFRNARLEPLDALVATVAVISFPAWPILANSYMTDLYALLLALPAAALFLRALERPSARLLAAATLLAAAGMLQRQVVLALPVAFMVAWLWGERRWTARVVATGLAPVAAVVAAELAYQAYLVHGPGLPEAQQAAHGRVLPTFLKIFTNDEGKGGRALVNLVTLCGYLGLFSFGWALWRGAEAMTGRTRVAIVAGGAALAGLALALVWLPPYRMNMVLDAAGIGPFTLYDAYTHGTSLDRAPGIFWRVAGVAAAFGLAALVALACANAAMLWRERRNAPRGRVFLAALVVAYLFPFVVVEYYDRYLLFVLPFLFALWELTWPSTRSAPSRPRRAVAIAWILAAVGLSAAATHDYFAWNRARWDAIRAAEKMGATRDTLDGGFEYNGFHGSDGRIREPPAGKSWWWVKDDEYVVAFIVAPGYEEVAAFPVRRWFERTPAVVRLLRRR